MTPKFRAWDIEKKEMVPVGKLEWFIDGSIILNEDAPVSYQGKTLIILMQSTGLKDKNGVEIYEGDIVEQEAIMSYSGEYGGAIDFLYTGAVVMIPSKGACLRRPIVHDRLEDDRKWRCDYYKTIASYRSKVIGNIHETPELRERRES